MSLQNGADLSRRVNVLTGWVAPFFWVERKRLLGVFLLSMIALAMSLLQPLLTKALIDDGVVNRNQTVLLQAGSLILMLSIVGPVVGFLTRRVYVSASSTILHRMREQMFLKILTLDQETIGRFHHGDILTRLESDLAEVQRFALDSAFSAINAIVLLVGTFSILGYMSPYLGVATVAVFALMSYVMTLLRPRLEMLSKATRDCGVKISSFLVERVHCIKHIQSFNSERRELGILQDLQRDARERTLELQVVGYAATSIPGLFLSLGISALFIGGGLLIIQGADLTLGILVAFTTYIQRISGPVQSISGLFVGWQRVKVSLARVMEIADYSHEDKRCREESACCAPAAKRGKLSIRELSYTYPGAQVPTLHGVNLYVKAGEKVHLRAPSGFGKTTLVELLHGHRKPQAGAICIDGISVESLDPRDLRRMVVVVGHAPVLLSGTVEANIRYGAPEADHHLIAHVARSVGLSKMLADEQRSLLTEVGVGGGNLSVGERQRVALARALLVQPRILVIDEGTSGLDLELESAILENLNAEFPDLTCIVISHRRLPAQWFDRVISLASLEFPSELARA